MNLSADNFPGRSISRDALILNVDDNDAARYAKTRILRGSGFTVIEAATGRDALERADADAPALILLDVKLPDMSGYDVCRAIRAKPQHSSTLIIQVSASFVGAGDRVRGLEGGADTYLTAPIDPPVLVATVNALLRLGRAEREIREKDERLRVALAASRTGTFRWDPGSGEFSFFDDNLRSLLDLGESQSVRTTADLLAAVHPDDRQNVASAFTHSVKVGNLELEFRVGDSGIPRWLYARGQLESGLRPGLAGACTDITRTKQAQAEREALLERERSARAEAERANRLKDEFVATLSHELRTPLSAIMGWTHVLKMSASDHETLAEGLDVITQSCRAQKELIDDLLDMSRVLSGKLRLTIRPANVSAIIDASISAVQPAADARSIAINRHPIPELGMIAADQMRLQQVVWNMLSNAVKFTPQGGHVDVLVTHENDMLRVQVTDTGMGIDPDFLPFVFERFRQADASTTRKFGGLGLGLSIAKSLIELHGGTIRATSPGLNQGATFEFEIPVRAMPPTLNARTPDDKPALVRTHPSNTPRLDGVRVLAVDDEPSARGLLVRFLESAGAEVALAESVPEALSVFRSVKPDVIVSDIGMPDQDGYALIRAVRSEPALKGGMIPVIALTAFAGSDDGKRMLAAGFSTHLSKPVEPRDLVTAVARVLERD